MGQHTTLAPAIEARIRQSFAAQAMMDTLGARLAEVATGLVRIEAPILPGSRQQHGFAHAGLSFTIGDSAAGYAALSVMPEGYEVLTTEMKIHLLAPAKGELLVAEGRVLRQGRRLVIVEADIHATEAGREAHVARLIGTMIPLESE